MFILVFHHLHLCTNFLWKIDDWLTNINIAHRVSKHNILKLLNPFPSSQWQFEEKWLGNFNNKLTDTPLKLLHDFKLKKKGEFEIQSRIAHPLATDHDISNLESMDQIESTTNLTLAVYLVKPFASDAKDFFLRFELAQKGVKKSTFSDKRTIFPF